ncbi:TonB-dependent receptor plug domain-containing protein [Ferrimonas senticii]|uniref:TonB-dependent receptor plug domain-containing protein n=1 Tax=Ferrimonas senticii TaxID=394566 RepID=UPI0004279B89|nr:TonB-dependent receptor [Ferrimonas senticii]
MSLHKPSLLALAITAAISGTGSSYAAEQDAAAENVERIAVTGSRVAPRSVDDSPVPIDIIDASEFERQGATDMDSMLSKVVPSYNVNDQPISDAATLVRPANLRGLSPDSTLILVNGKRRHRAAVITFLGGGISDGSQAPDVSTIPTIALDSVEVLRDGAAAIYGSDAIAGVINFKLKDDAEGGSLQARYGQYYEGDGDTITVAGNIGLPLSENGFINFSGEYRTVDPTSRSVQRDDAAGLIAAGNTAVANPAQIWGSPEVEDDYKFFVNAGLQLNDTDEAYLFGSYAERTAIGGFYFRNPETRSGVFADADGNPLIADLTDDMSGNCDGLTREQAMASATCFVFNELFPGGFTPSFGGDVLDLSLYAGVRGEFNNGLNYDFSMGLGRNEVEFFINNTVNASLGPDTPTSFRPGKYVQIEQGYNADFGYAFDSFDLAFGAEYRNETFEVYAGDPASFEIGPLAAQGFGTGSNGFPGFQPEAQGSESRGNYALYAQVGSDLTDDLFMDAAVRFEDYETFGTTTNFKVSGIYELTDNLGLRAAVNTGFRAPTVGQESVRNVTTQFSATGLQDQATLPPTNPIAVQTGGKPLEPEESVSYSFGVVANFGDIDLTVDYYNIAIDDRISQTSPIELTDADIQELLDNGYADAASFTSVRYFTNDFDTTTQGIDVVASYPMTTDFGDIKFSLAYGWNETEVDSFNPDNISETKVRLLEENLPHHKGSLSFEHSLGAFDNLLRVNYFGSYYEDHIDSEVFPIEGSAAWTVDAEISYSITDTVVASVGAQNLLDERPDDNPYAGVAGSEYPTTAPIGINGGLYYVRLAYNF